MLFRRLLNYLTDPIASDPNVGDVPIFDGARFVAGPGGAPSWLLHTAGIPDNSQGSNGDYALGQDGVIYKKQAGTWGVYGGGGGSGPLGVLDVKNETTIGPINAGGDAVAIVFPTSITESGTGATQMSNTQFDVPAGLYIVTLTLVSWSAAAPGRGGVLFSSWPAITGWQLAHDEVLTVNGQTKPITWVAPLAAPLTNETILLFDDGDMGSQALAGARLTIVRLS